MRLIKRSFAKINISEKTQAFIDKEKLYNCQNYAPMPFVITRGQGSYVWDADGKKYLDCICGFSTLAQGHLHPRIKKAIINQLDVLTHTGRGTHHDKLADATEYLTKTFNYDKAILMNTGVEAGETAIKFARRWAYEVKKIPKNEAWILFAKNNFWGRTITACGTSDDPDRYNNFGPYCPNTKLLEYNNADAFENELKNNPNVAAIMMEPIQGEAGVILPTEEFMQRLRKMCTQYNVLLIIDEVQTGIGRTGKLLCQEHYGVKGDLVTLGKVISGGFFPISAVLGTNEVFNCIVPGAHGSTFGGNPLACVTMMESIQTVKDEGMIENSAKLGKLILDDLVKRTAKFPFVKRVRGKGLFFAFDICLQTGPDVKELLYKFAENGLLAKNARPETIRFAPPLILTETEANMIVDVIVSSLESLTK